MLNKRKAKKADTITMQSSRTCNPSHGHTCRNSYSEPTMDLTHSGAAAAPTMRCGAGRCKTHKRARSLRHQQ